MATGNGDDDLERHFRSLLQQYGELRIEQADMSRTIEERTADALRVRQRVDDQLGALNKDKASAADLAAVIVELKGIKRLLIGLLVSITLASVGFGFAALQIAGSHT